MLEHVQRKPIIQWWHTLCIGFPMVFRLTWSKLICQVKAQGYLGEMWRRRAMQGDHCCGKEAVVCWKKNHTSWWVAFSCSILKFGLLYWECCTLLNHSGVKPVLAFSKTHFCYRFFPSITNALFSSPLQHETSPTKAMIPAKRRVEEKEKNETDIV